MQVQELTDEGYKSGARFRNRIEDAGPQNNPHTPPAETSQKRMRKNPNNGRKIEKVTRTLSDTKQLRGMKSGKSKTLKQHPLKETRKLGAL